MEKKDALLRWPVAQALAFLTGLAARGPGLAQSPPLTAKTKNGLGVEIANLPQPAPLNQMMTVNLRLVRNGQPARASSIAVEGLRLFSKNALPTAPAATPLRETGSWRLDGLRFHIAGPWRLIFRVQTEDGAGEVVLPLEVK